MQCAVPLILRPRLCSGNAGSDRNNEAVGLDAEAKEDVFPRHRVRDLAEEELKRRFIQELLVANAAALHFLELILSSEPHQPQRLLRRDRAMRRDLA